MARKFNDEHIAGIFTGFGLTCTTPAEDTQTQEQPVPQTVTAPQPVTAPQTSSPTSVEIEEEPKPKEKRKPKKDRVSFMCRISESNLRKIRLLSATSCKSLSDVIDSSITEYFKNHEHEYGDLLSRVQ